MNPEIQKVLKMSKEGTITEDQAAELIDELVKKQTKASHDWKKESTEGLGDAVSTIIEKTVNGAINMTGMNMKNTSHVEGLFLNDLQTNSFHMSKVEAPSGGEYVFKGNSIRMSHLKRIALNRAEFTENKIDASKLDEMSATDSEFSRSSVQASAIEKFSIDHAHVFEAKILSSKWNRVTIEDQSTMERVKINACAVKGLKITGHSLWQDSVISGAAIANLESENSKVTEVEIQASHIEDTSFSNSTLSSLLLRGIRFGKVKFIDCKMYDVLFSGKESWSWKNWNHRGLENVAFEGCQFDKVLFSDCRWTKTTIKNVTLTDFKIQDVDLSGLTINGNDEFLAAMQGKKTR